MAKRHRVLRKTLLSFFLKCSKNQKLMRNSNLRDFRISSFGDYMGQSIGRQPLKNLWKDLWKTAFKKFYLVHSWILCPIYM